MASLGSQLRILGAGRVLTDPATRRRYSTDASVFRIEPAAVVAPRSVRDLARLIRFVSQRRKAGDRTISLTPRAAGSDMTGGPLSESVVVDLVRYFDKVRAIGRDRVTVQPGVYYRDLDRQLAERGLFYPAYPASKSLAAVGGIVANNAAGEQTLRYGQTDRHVLGLKTVLADGRQYIFRRLRPIELRRKEALQTFEGNLYRRIHQLIRANHELITSARPRTSKNSTGYNLWSVLGTDGSFDLGQLLVGSQGTLGIISEVTLHVVPIEPHAQMIVGYLPSLDRLDEAVDALRRLGPTSLELFDRETLRLAIRYAPMLASLIGREQSLLRLAGQLLPDLHIVAVRGLPALILMAEFTGPDEAGLARQLDHAATALNGLGLPVVRAPSRQAAEKYWVIRRQSFNLLRTKLRGVQTVPFIDDVIVDPSRLGEFLPRLGRILADYPELRFSIAGHAGNGNLHIFPLLDMTRPKLRALIPKIADRVYRLVLLYDGSLSAEHNDGLIRGPYLQKMYGPQMTHLFRQIKRIFDPLGIFNPHKKTGATLKYAQAHLKTDNEHTV